MTAEARAAAEACMPTLPGPLSAPSISDPAESSQLTSSMDTGAMGAMAVDSWLDDEDTQAQLSSITRRAGDVLLNLWHTPTIEACELLM